MFTKENANPIINELKNQGFKPRLVGSIKTMGCSEHDIDIALPIMNRKGKKYLGYYKIMKKFNLKGRRIDKYLDKWKSNSLAVDIFFS